MDRSRRADAKALKRAAARRVWGRVADHEAQQRRLVKGTEVLLSPAEGDRGGQGEPLENQVVKGMLGAVAFQPDLVARGEAVPPRARQWPRGAHRAAGLHALADLAVRTPQAHRALRQHRRMPQDRMDVRALLDERVVETDDPHSTGGVGVQGRETPEQPEHANNVRASPGLDKTLYSRPAAVGLCYPRITGMRQAAARAALSIDREVGSRYIDRVVNNKGHDLTGVRAARGGTVLVGALVIDSLGNGLFLPLSLVFFLKLTAVPLAELGVLASVATLVTLPVPIWAGSLADKFGALPLVVAAQLMQAVGYLAYAWVRTPWSIFAASALVAVGVRFFWSSIFTAIADYADASPGRRSKDSWYALANAARTAGLAAGG